jgi:hypothetical protein
MTSDDVHANGGSRVLSHPTRAEVALTPRLVKAGCSHVVGRR